MKYLLLSSAFIIFLSCSGNELEPCELPDPTTVGFEIGISDATGNPLINHTYVQDSFKLWNNDETLFLRLSNFGIGGDNSRLSIGYAQIQSGSSYWLELDSEVIDTFRFNFDFILPQNGCSYYDMTEITYNGTVHPISQETDQGWFIFTED